MNKLRFGEFIKEKRGSKSRRLFGESLGVSESYVVDIEIGKTVPAADKILLIAEALNVDAGDLFRLLDDRLEDLENPGELIVLPPSFSANDREEVEYFIAFKEYLKQVSQQRKRPLSRQELRNLGFRIIDFLPGIEEGQDPNSAQPA